MRSNYLLIMMLFGLSLSTIQAQTKSKNSSKKTKSTKTLVKSNPLKLVSLKDSLSYALGLDIANSLKQAEFDLNSTVLTNAIVAKLNGDSTLFKDDQLSSIISKAMVEIKAKPGRDFLDANKKKANVKVTPEGLQYEVLVEGDGVLPTSNDEVIVHYAGTLINGEKFDSSYDRNEPLTLDLNRVIEGWKIGIPLMKIGSKYKFYIPYELGYGERGTGAIPAFSTLIFEVELLGVKGSSGI